MGMNSPRFAHLDQQFALLIARLGVSADVQRARAFLHIGKASIEGDPLTTQDLVRFLGMTEKCALYAVAHFVERGYVSKVRCETDARAKHLVLTDAGLALFRELLPYEGA